MEQRFDLLFEEYKKSYENINEKLLLLQFKKSLENNGKVRSTYLKFLEEMDLVSRRGVIELNQSEYDTILPYIQLNSLGFSISKYYKENYRNQSNKTGYINGEVVVENNDVYALYCNKKRKMDMINNYITQYPYDKKTIDTMADIISINKNAFIGLYGNINEKNRMEKLKELYDIKQELQAYLGKTFASETAENQNYYFAAITPKLVYRNKKK